MVVVGRRNERGQGTAVSATWPACPPTARCSSSSPTPDHHHQLLTTTTSPIHPQEGCAHQTHHGRQLMGLVSSVVPSFPVRNSQPPRRPSRAVPTRLHSIMK